MTDEETMREACRFAEWVVWNSYTFNFRSTPQTWFSPSSYPRTTEQLYNMFEREQKQNRGWEDKVLPEDATENNIV